MADIKCERRIYAEPEYTFFRGTHCPEGYISITEEDDAYAVEGCYKDVYYTKHCDDGKMCSCDDKYQSNK